MSKIYEEWNRIFTTTISEFRDHMFNLEIEIDKAISIGKTAVLFENTLKDSISNLCMDEQIMLTKKYVSLIKEINSTIDKFL